MTMKAVLGLAALALIGVVGLMGSCSGQPDDAGTPPRPVVVGSLPLGDLEITTDATTVTYQVEVAETPQARARGLMFIDELPAGYGMVFLYEQPTENGFWMKNTLIPLEIAFWDQSGEIVSLLRMEPCRQDPCPGYPPGSPYIGAVETAEGTMTGAGIGVGSKVKLTRID